MNEVAGAQNSDDRHRLFVSYSHYDARWLSQLEVALKPLAVRLELWSDRNIVPGTKWLNEIQEALAKCTGGIVLVSPHFLASDFIASHELPPLLASANSKGVRILWIAVSASLVEETDLAAFQALNDPAKPLDSLSRPELNKTLADIARKIKAVLTPATTTFRSGLSAQQPDPLSLLFLSFTSVAEADLSTLGVDRSQITELLRSEFRSHPILASIDYELSPRPLQQGYYALLTKLGQNVSVEHLSKCHWPPDQMKVWSDLCAAYARAYALPFRQDHVVLLKESEYRRTSRILATLLESLAKYIYQSPVYQDPERFPKLHRLKQEAEDAFVSAERGYDLWLSRPDANESGLGAIALELDRVISGVHKIILEYQCRQ